MLVFPNMLPPASLFLLFERTYANHPSSGLVRHGSNDLLSGVDQPTGRRWKDWHGFY